MIKKTTCDIVLNNIIDLLVVNIDNGNFLLIIIIDHYKLIYSSAIIFILNVMRTY